MVCIHFDANDSRTLPSGRQSLSFFREAAQNNSGLVNPLADNSEKRVLKTG
ncbi:hypothetical protein Q7C_2055 [Methylophaga frappieri]|uniref:Uncharacterized protein n=2 Tax=Methylophaga frappieri (strain ATCC BAA-2434 / DSM 25690 / JAM7) TaxID=754477 RepID=I1YJV1_METFJ|nr:hypothetical protein Q7C_2055 [Methylophaga frappieri]